MARFDTGDPEQDVYDSLIGRPSLRRRFRSLAPDQREAIAGNLDQSIDPARFRSRYREQLQSAIENTVTANPLNERDRLTTLMRDPKLSTVQRSQINDQLRRLPKPQTSIEDRFDPRNPNSVAYRQFGTLFRS